MNSSSEEAQTKEARKNRPEKRVVNEILGRISLAQRWA